MKKFLLSFVVVLCVTMSANAQAIYGYGLSINEGSYTPITDGTIVALGTNELFQTTYDDWGDPVNNFNEKLILPSGIFDEEITAEGFPIGFDFKFNDKMFSSFGIATNGVIYLGDETVTLYTDGRYTFSNGSGNNLIGFVGNRGNICNDETIISYKTEGEAPNRVLTVEFDNLGFLQGFWGIEAYFFDIQFRLYEGSNEIELVVNGADEAFVGIDDEGNTETYSTNATIGVKGEGDDATRVFAGELNEWYPENATSNDFYLDYNILDGTTFKFTEPDDVVTPEVQPMNLIVNQYSTQLTGSFTAVEGVDTYLLIYQEGTEITSTPIDKTSYSPGDNVGDAIVVEYYESWDYENVFEFELWDLPSATDYTFAVYAVNAYGANGPLYNTVNPPTVVTYTNPAAATLFEFVEVGDSTAVINLSANAADNKVLVVYNTELVRDNYGDYPLIGELSGEYVAGQEIDGGGFVAYFGDAVENIEITGLEHSKGYFFEAYSYDPTYGYSTDKLSADAATTAYLPYSLDLSAAKTYGLPAGWTKNEESRFEIPNSVTGYTSEENPYVIWCKETRKDAENGIINQLTSCPIVVDQRDAVVKFDFAMYYQPSRFATDAYNDWAEGDVFAVQLSTDGETFTDLETYTPENHPEFIYNDTVKSFAQFEGELAQYEGQKIWIRIHWQLFSAAFLPGVLVIDNIAVEGREIPETPIVKVDDVTHISANISWRGAQENYEVAFAKSGEEFTTQVVEGATEITFSDLEAETEYQVKVRGIAAENDYSYWSEVVTFTTEAWPECEAPTDLLSDVTLFLEEGIVTLSWDGNEEHLFWEVRYRDGNSTTWNTIENIEEPLIVLNELEEGVTYLWNVRAYCTVDRITDWSAQSSFETPKTVGPPTNVTAVATGPYTMTLSWDPVDGALAYGIFLFGEFLGGTYNTSVDLEQMTPETEYCFTVVSITGIDDEGYITDYSEESEEACATTEPDGIEELASSINVHPNPVNDVLFIENGNNIEEISIYTITGVMVYNEQCTANNVQLNVSEFEAGVYILKVRTEDREIINRFVKK